MKKLLLILAVVMGVVVAPVTTSAGFRDNGYWESYTVTERVPYWTTERVYVCERVPFYDSYYGRRSFDRECFYESRRVKKFKNERVTKYRWVEYTRPVVRRSVERAYDRGYGDGFYDGRTGRSYNDDRYDNYYSNYYGYEL